MTQMDHVLFGKITYDLYWSGQLKITIFGKKSSVILSIDGNENGDFQEAQKQAYCNLLGDIDRIMAQTEEAIGSYYRKIIMECGEEEGAGEADEKSSVNIDKEQLRHLVVPTQLIIRRVRNDGNRRIGLLFDCTWDDEHGLAIKFENEKIVEVGLQDIVL